MITSKLFVNLSIFATCIQITWTAVIFKSINQPKFKTTESICNQQYSDMRVTSEGKESSLTLDLHPGLNSHGLCKRVLIAPESHGFFIRLAHAKGGKMQSSSSSLGKNLRGMTAKATNSTNSCPLSIFTTTDQVTIPWRIDPCQLEAFSEEQVKLLPGKIRIIWDHGGNIPNFKLIITTVGKGQPCQKKDKFPCLHIGFETLICISRDLICDGIRHCPKGTSYENDEDSELCSGQKNDGIDNEFWEKLTMEFFRSFLTTTEISTNLSTKGVNGGINNMPSSHSPNNKYDNKNPSRIKTTMITTESDSSQETTTTNKRNITRSNVVGSDLSKYGPWGYLMLGMLLCGGALLICGLWECCCRQNKSSDTNITGSTLPSNNADGENATTNVGQIAPTTATVDIRPPNYEELDPPPSYATLFPNQKELSDLEMDISPALPPPPPPPPNNPSTNLTQIDSNDTSSS